MTKAIGSPQKILEQLQANSDRPLLQRCMLMEDVLKTVSSKELRHIFPSLLHEIFDFDRSQYSGWRLDCVSQPGHPELFQRIRNMLGPEGHFMKLINTLHGDPYAQYEFPLECLPAPTKHLIGEGAFPAFYANKIQIQSPTASVLILNAFELYMFHLAYALVSPTWRTRNEGWASILDYVYPTVIDDMLLYFFPCDKISLPSSPQYTSSPVRQQGSLNSMPGYSYNSQQTPLSSYSPHAISPQRTLFKSSFVNAQKQNQQNLPHIDQGETETWQSETFLQVLTEFWLNQNSGPGIEQHALSSTFQEHFMPHLKHVKMVRLLVKYLHLFSNSATSLITSTYQQAVMTPLDQFKRLIIPVFLQKKLYAFLRHAFDRWPLESSFRWVLETWLSYIQPWRYVDFGKKLPTDARGTEAETKKVDDKWDQFVEENLLFYSVLLGEFLPRIHRMDLSSVQSAYMVYRVSRIFSLPQLPNLIFKAEQEVFGSTLRVDLRESYLSSRPHFASVTLPSQIFDLEGANFQCPQFFSEIMRHNIASVINDLNVALMKVRAQQEEFKKEESRADKGFFATLFGSNSSSRHLESPEFKQLPVHLEEGIRNFCQIFDIPIPISVSPSLSLASESNTSIGTYSTAASSSASNVNQSIVNDSMYLTDGDKRLPHCIETEQGLKLTDLGRCQLINRECRFDKFDMGDPDLFPVRSYENGTVVRLLFHLCFFINSYFKSELSSLYYRPTFIGQFSRVFLTAPVMNKSNTPRSPTSHVSHYLEQSSRPRFSLRFLASYHNLFHFGIAYALSSLLFGIGIFSFLFLTFCFVLILGLLTTTIRCLTNKTSQSTL